MKPLLSDGEYWISEGLFRILFVGGSVNLSFLFFSFVMKTVEPEAYQRHKVSTPAS